MKRFWVLPLLFYCCLFNIHVIAIEIPPSSLMTQQTPNSPLSQLSFVSNEQLAEQSRAEPSTIDINKNNHIDEKEGNRNIVMLFVILILIIVVMLLFVMVNRQKHHKKELLQVNETVTDALLTRSRFFASMSHDLRTPIVGMIGLLELLILHNKSEEDLILLNNLIKSARNLHSITNDILDFSKLEAEQMQLCNQNCHILKESGELIRVYSTLAKNKGLQFEFNFKPTKIEIISIDSLRYAQIINNLLSNAVKFTQVGTITVDIEVGDSILTCSVSDTGQGMTEQQLQEIYKPYVQADNTVAKKYGGTGLGLTIVHDLIKLMGGTMTFASEYGKGTVATFQFPHQLVQYYEENLSDLDIHYLGRHQVIQRWLSCWGIINDPTRIITKSVIIDDCNATQSRALHKNSLIADSKQYRHIFLNAESSVFKCVNDNEVEIGMQPLFADILFDALVTLATDDIVQEINVIQPLSGTVLVVEDNPINQLLMKKQLQEMGLKVGVASNGEEAFDLLTQEHVSVQKEVVANRWDLLITDLHMPIMDGLSLAQKIRHQRIELNDMKIIACTAEDPSLLKQKVENRIFDRLFYKSYSLKQLNDLLKEYLPLQTLSVTDEYHEEKSQELQIVTELIQSEKVMPDIIEEQQDNANSLEIAAWLNGYEPTEGTSLANIFIDTMVIDLKELKALDVSKMQLRQLAHRIKGGASVVGVDEIMVKAARLESCIDQNLSSQEIQENSQQLVLVLEREIRKAKNWITAYEE